jgi:hypothetical protein
MQLTWLCSFLLICFPSEKFFTQLLQATLPDDNDLDPSIFPHHLKVHVSERKSFIFPCRADFLIPVNDATIAPGSYPETPLSMNEWLS